MSPIQPVWVAPGDKSAVCRFADVTDGTYAIAVSHDLNGNQKTDTNFFGIPTERGRLRERPPDAARPDVLRSVVRGGRVIHRTDRGGRTMTERPTQPRRLAKFGKSALVTGASDGIGRATALGLAEKGFDLILVARRKDHLDRVAEEAHSTSGVEVRPVVADLSTAHGLEVVRQVIAEERPGIGVLSAGYGTSGPFVSSDLDGEVDMLGVNCRAVLTLAHDLTGQMVRNGAGSLSFSARSSGFKAMPGRHTMPRQRPTCRAWRRDWPWNSAPMAFMSCRSPPGL